MGTTGRGVLRPWDPIYLKKAKRGALNAVPGNTPPYVPLPTITGTGAPTQANQTAAGSGTKSLTYYEAVLADSPAAYWRMNELSGSTAFDSSPNGRNAVFVNSPTLGVTGPYNLTTAMTSAVTGTKYFNYGGGVALANAKPFTIEIWTNTALAANHTLMSARSTGTGLPGYLFRVLSTGAVNWLGFGAGASTLSTATGAVTANTWTHIAITCDGSSNAVIYIDGVSAATGSLTTINFPGASAVRLSGAVITAAGPTVAASDGTNSDLAIWNSALSGAQIAAHYAAA